MVAMKERASAESLTTALVSFWSRGQRTERAAYVVGAVLMVSGVIHIAILIMTSASWIGPLSLRKAATFGLSFGLTLLTVTWVASFLTLSKRARAILLGLFTAACVLETTLVSLQAWRGVPSHFNVETTFDAMVARMLAAGGFVLVVIIVVLTLSAFQKDPTVPISLRIAIRIGFIALVSAAAVGGVMIARGMTLVFAGDPQAAYASGGTLKPTHGVTMHGLLVLPAAAWLLSFADLSERHRTSVVLVAAAGYLVLVAVVTVANFMGLELHQMPPTTIGLLAVGAFLLLGSGLLSLAAVVRTRTMGIQHR
jgi:hypothetical protein